MDPTCVFPVIMAIILLIVCKTFTTDPTIFFTVLIAAIILIMVVRFYENSNADLIGDLRDANNKNKNLQEHCNRLQLRVHCDGCPNPTHVHHKRYYGENGTHCCDKYGDRMCDCEITPTDRRSDPP